MKLVGGCRMPVHGFMPQLVIGCQIVGTCCLIVRVAFPYRLASWRATHLADQPGFIHVGWTGPILLETMVFPMKYCGS